MKTVSEIVRLGPVIPVLAFDSVEQGENVSRALHAGGVKVLEITLRTAAGLEAIERASQLADDIVVGVGTITKPEHCAQAKKAGAQFGVSPGLTQGHAQGCARCGLAAAAGRDDADGHHRGDGARLRDREVFPGATGGRRPDAASASTARSRTLKFCPTGGITAETAPSFLALPNVVCVGGSWLTPKAALAAQNWEEVTRLARAASTAGAAQRKEATPANKPLRSSRGGFFTFGHT